MQEVGPCMSPVKHGLPLFTLGRSPTRRPRVRFFFTVGLVESLGPWYIYFLDTNFLFHILPPLVDTRNSADSFLMRVQIGLGVQSLWHAKNRYLTL